ncbi:hypothetical protein GGX14DRAFT_392330 [Mycena pura]|uniref:Uncharacterized protein n=1 Tax=Mycena pura TaxID=153505 RepID=A0AAD6VK12_9AGAR|nr:hypothetical protein GGX14DRAFT_392330 [Mycena pura]
MPARKPMQPMSECQAIPTSHAICEFWPVLATNRLRRQLHDSVAATGPGTGSHWHLTLTASTYPMVTPTRYFTQQDKAAACAENKRRYRAQPHVKAAEAEAKRRRSRGKVARALPDTVPHMAPLDPNILGRALLPLPTTDENFQDALDGKFSETWLSNSLLVVWRTRPPFEQDLVGGDTDPEGCRQTPADLHVAQSILHGLHLHAQNIRDELRRSTFRARGWDAGFRALRQEICRMQEGMAELAVIEYTPGSQHCEMLQFWLQWEARAIYHLYYLNFLC